MPYDRTKPLPSRERLMELLSYNADTGVFTWKQRPAQGVQIGDVAGGVCTTTGYHRIRIDGVRHKASRLAWLYVHGDPVPFEVDHINRIRTDDRIANLRDGETDNMRNKSVYKTNKTGVPGVTWHSGTKRWAARIQVAGNRRTIGYYSTVEAAKQARIHEETRLRAIGEWV